MRDDDDDRPRKKKRKKPKPAGPNPAMVAGLVIGGVLLVGGVVAAVALTGRSRAPEVASAPTPAPPTGVAVAATPAPAPQPAPAPAPAPQRGPVKSTNVYRAVDRTRHGDYMRQIGLALRNYELTAMAGGPKSLEELAPYYENNGKINEAVKEGDIVVVWNMPASAFRGSTNLWAYEGSPDQHNQRLVLTSDGAVNRMSEADFAARPKK